jgi:bifunctional UDP-N-acetylglucosamine pyrophosphorylase/glucosamine-1-phosphate N-acetyltransferase
MRAVILAAGKGKRMGPLTSTRAKTMLPVLNKPILEHLIINARKAGVKEFVVVVNWQADRIKEYFERKDNLGVKIYWAEQREVVGTANAIFAAEPWVKEDFLVLSGDTLLGTDSISQLAKAEEPAIGIAHVEEPERYGVVSLDGKKVKKVIEKPKVPESNFINIGCYHFDERIFEAISKTPLSDRKEYEITTSINMMLEEDIAVGAVGLEDWIDITFPWDLLTANRILIDKLKPNIEGEVEDNVKIRGKVVIEEGCRVLGGSYIEGPTLIGKNCEIGPNCYIRPVTVLGEGCKVGNASDVKNSLLMKNSKVPHQGYAGDSIIGENVNLGAGTKLANLRLDRSPILVKIDEEYVQSGLKKFGAVVGDGVQFGVNSVTNPGTVIGAFSMIGPGAVVYEEVKERSEIYR